MAGDGFKVDPAELHKFGDYLSRTTAPAVQQSASGVHAANGFDDQAFGVILAQILAIPARIALAAVAGNVDKASQDITQVAESTVKAAEAYRNQDEAALSGLGDFAKELGQ
ncbi:hypothetical protein [Amycolatopsis alkalitolerans]|uniref:ESX-1 secretion-associated protein n=1 Tax=Amycolatopsis alkalitolerans TaxID=2547244 RepID=A0A5C4MAZ9_9PSEU|nr:hypothetical protein [Amycolatopsis alkalitolerans]TNC29070.1 hypothetical protein FG385_02895 [Amycolatopsis alkalitolerans]